MKNSVGHVFNVPIPTKFEHVENVLHESFTGSERHATFHNAVVNLAAGSRREPGHLCPL